jgi:ribonuclease P protein component
VLPAAHRLTDGDAFRHAVRRGRRAGGPVLVVHLALVDEVRPGRVGLVVSRAVGNAVVRNRVKRRLRHLAREHLATLEGLPGSAVLVVRAQPAAAGASYPELGAELARCLDTVTVKASHQASRAATHGADEPTGAQVTT